MFSLLSRTTRRVAVRNTVFPRTFFGGGRRTPEVSVEEYVMLQNEENYFDAVVDVREVHELESGFIPNSVNKPLSSFMSNLDNTTLQLEGLKVLVYCAAGVRSAKVTALLRQVGIEAWNLEGGISAYKHISNIIDTPDFEKTVTLIDVKEKIEDINDSYRG